MDTRRLEIFLRVMDAGGISRAARLLGMAQPAVSQQLNALEGHFGAALVVRSARGVTPTPAGNALYRHARLVLRQLEHALAEVRQASVEVSGIVTIAMPFTAAALLTVPLLQAARLRLPNVQLDFASGLNGAMLDEFTASGRVDIGLLPGPVMGKLRTKPLFAERLVLVVSPESALGKSFEAVDFSDLHDVLLVLPSRINQLRRVIDESFNFHGITPKVVAEMNSIYSLGRVAAANFGATIMPLAAAGLLAEQVIIRELKNPTPERAVWLATTDAGPPSMAAAAVFDLVAEQCASLVDSGQWAGARLLAR